MVGIHRDGGGPWIHLYGFVGPGWILDRKEIIGEAVKYLCSIEFVVDLGGPWIHLYDFLGPGWILDKKEILGEPVKWLYPTKMVVDLGGPWNTPLWFPWARVDLG